MPCAEATKPARPSRRYMVVADVCRVYAISPWSLRRMLRDGKIKAVKFVDKGNWKVDLEDLERVLDEVAAK